MDATVKEKDACKVTCRICCEENKNRYEERGCLSINLREG